MKTESFYKSEVYERCLREITQKAKNKTLLERMEIVCKGLKQNIPYYFWIGFYFPKQDFLELGPSIGTPACAQIPFIGVCGQTAKSRKPNIVPDVNQFTGHVVCDPRSMSEISLPVFNRAGEVMAVLDVDSESLGSFDETDCEWLEKILKEVFSV
jgi:L-methionine (R)-S-oxide reductase